MPQTPIVLLHGVGLDHTMWEPFTRATSRLTDQPIIAIDLPGHGSRPSLTREATLADLADDVGARLPERSHLVGFSLGALIGQHVARFHPERVASLTSVSSVCQRTEGEASAVASRLVMGVRDFPASVAASIQRWFPDGSGVAPETIAATRTILHSNDVPSYLHAYQVFAIGDATIGPELGNIDVPSFAVTGELDSGSTPEMTRRLGEAIPGCRTAVVPGVGHMLPIQEPDELARLIISFIAESTGDSHA